MSQQMLDAAHGRTPQASHHVTAMTSLSRAGHSQPRRVEGSCVVRSSGRGAREWRHAWREGQEERQCVAHLVGDRGYVREVWQDRRTGERSENRDLYGLQEGKSEWEESEIRASCLNNVDCVLHSTILNNHAIAGNLPPILSF